MDSITCSIPSGAHVKTSNSRRGQYRRGRQNKQGTNTWTKNDGTARPTASVVAYHYHPQVFQLKGPHFPMVANINEIRDYNFGDDVAHDRFLDQFENFAMRADLRGVHIATITARPPNYEYPVKLDPVRLQALPATGRGRAIARQYINTGAPNFRPLGIGRGITRAVNMVNTDIINLADRHRNKPGRRNNSNNASNAPQLIHNQSHQNQHHDPYRQPDNYVDYGEPGSEEWAEEPDIE